MVRPERRCPGALAVPIGQGEPYHGGGGGTGRGRRARDTEAVRVTASGSSSLCAALGQSARCDAVGRGPAVGVGRPAPGGRRCVGPGGLALAGHSELRLPA